MIFQRFGKKLKFYMINIIEMQIWRNIVTTVLIHGSQVDSLLPEEF